MWKELPACINEGVDEVDCDLVVVGSPCEGVEDFFLFAPTDSRVLEDFSEGC
jgi:hypothetical protein